jgi:hypothetical protein
MLIVASLLLGMMMNSGEAMDYRAVPLGNSDIVILMSGPIRRGDLDKLHAFIRNRTKDVHGLYGFALNSPGGDLLEAETISQFIRKVNALTIVGDGDLCASACFLLFAAGKGKVVHPRAKIAVHSVSVDNHENPSALAATTAMARDAATLGVPPAIIGKMVTMPARGVDFLSRQDLASMDASFTSDAPDDTFRK